MSENPGRSQAERIPFTPKLIQLPRDDKQTADGRQRLQGRNDGKVGGN
jgi:hypothetical protein